MISVMHASVFFIAITHALYVAYYLSSIFLASSTISSNLRIERQSNYSNVDTTTIYYSSPTTGIFNLQNCDLHLNKSL